MIEYITQIFFNLFLMCLALSLFFVLRRLKMGPSLADRVIAIDLFSAILLGAIIYTSVFAQDDFYFDVALIFALFTFLTTAIYARFIDRQGKQPRGLGDST